MRHRDVVRGWWARRSLRVRVTLVVGTVALATVLVLARLAAGVVTWSLGVSADAELRGAASTAVTQLRAGTPVAQAVRAGLRLVDTAGQPADGGLPLPLDVDQVRALAAGQTVVTGRAYAALRRWVAEPVVLSDGATRLVVATGALVGGTTLVARAAVVFLLGAFVVAAVLAGAAWVGTRAALRPVDRLRTAAAALPPGERLPVPHAADELRSLAEELNRLLARRDDAVARLERFAGDAAHELRSPVAAIRAQAEVAVAHPDPELAADVLASVVDEATRLSVVLADLLALARADADARPPAEAVDLVAAAGAALGRASTLRTDGPVLELVAPAPAQVAATESEVGSVLDNLLANGRRHARSFVRVTVLPAGREVRLLVEDDGPGIPPGDRERVFDRFTRLDPHGGGGAGLGLALVAALVLGRDGTVTAGESGSGGARLEVRWRSGA